MNKFGMKNAPRSVRRQLLGATFISLIALTVPVFAQDTNDAGFTMAINGVTVDADPRIINEVQQADVALDRADIRVVFDGLGAKPRLDLEVVGPSKGHRAGETVTFQSAMNYPAYVTKGEIRLIDLDARGGPRTLRVVPAQPNAEISVTVPEGGNIVAVHRVYDANGRFDETYQVDVTGSDGRRLVDEVEEGSDNSSRRSIPVYGGAVTVSGSNVAPGSVVRALGESVRPAENGKFVIQRILPEGAYDVDVRVDGPGSDVAITRPIDIPQSEWFYVATADLTFGFTDSDDGGSDTYTNGRLAFFADGKTASGYRVTASADTGDGPLEDIFRRLDDNGPSNLLERVDPADLFPTYGDDSTSEDLTPSSGRFFIRIARENNYVQWGDFQANLAGNTYLRNERSLYGLSGRYETLEQTSEGEAKAAVDLFVAQPDMAADRDVFLGTGGSVYVLRRADIGRATETVTVQLRDRVTGRVLETRNLEAGRDYFINYVQGIVTLSAPLQSTSGDRLITEGTRQDTDVQLVVQYEYTPATGDLDGTTVGGRVEGWVSDTVRLGFTGVNDTTGADDQTALGADLLFQKSERTFLRFDVARSEGPGFGSSLSADGGLIVDTVAGAAGDGEAVRIEAQADLVELGFGREGTISAYAEDRSAGFSTLDYQVDADQTLWGFAADVDLTDSLRVSAYYDAFDSDDGTVKNTGGVTFGYELTETVTLDFGVEHRERRDGTDDGDRTDAAAKLTYEVSDLTSVYVFGQNTINRDGLDRNDRLGAGFDYGFGNGWTVSGEVSDGTSGEGGRLLANYTDDSGNTRYFGYELDAGRTLPGVTLDGTDRGRVVAGGRQQLTGSVTVFGENSYDVFGRQRTLTSAYGATYAVNDALSYSAALELGQVDDEVDNDFERKAVSLGVGYDSEMVTAAARLEFRNEDGTRSGDPLETDVSLFSGRFAYKLDESNRVVGSAEFLKTQSNQADILDGNYTDLSLGYALRPIQNERTNLLARVRYLSDEIGQRVDDVDGRGPLQKSTVLSFNVTHDLSTAWTIGGAFSYRDAETAADSAAAFSDNDAWFGALNARYHFPFEWDALIEVRNLTLIQGDTSNFGFLGAVYKQINPNAQIGVGYNFGSFSNDLTDLVKDDQGIFLNIVAQF